MMKRRCPEAQPISEERDSSTTNSNSSTNI